jgi:hypothetical protein
LKIEDDLKTLLAQYLIDYSCPRKWEVYEYSIDKALLYIKSNGMVEEEFMHG